MSRQLHIATAIYLSFFGLLGHAFRASWQRPNRELPRVAPESASPITPTSPKMSATRPKFTGTNPTPTDWFEFRWRDLGNAQSHLKIKNRTAIPAVCLIRVLERQNVEFEPKLPLVVSIGGLENKLVCKAYNVNRNQRSRWNTPYQCYAGKLNRPHQPETPYRLPYRSGVSAYLLSAPTNQQLPIPYLFGLPEDSEILAARAGKVVYTEERYDRSGMGPEFELRVNQVIVLHNDGTLAHYKHLGAQDVVVQVGQSIQAGQLIGYSGQTGRVNSPALGFSVTSLSPTPSYQYHKLSFVVDSSGNGKNLEPLQSYLAP